MERKQLVAGAEEFGVNRLQLANEVAAKEGVQVAVVAVRLSLARMERAGAVLTTSEAAAFELLEDAKHPKFKEVQALYK